ncbi:hypothetical protein TNIN_460471 [Trichonephila inaurata madagascariensis]|uniref:Uncharacterized protein n=1 Tax=Trichonephila inaurata madagascariensis TaxID=2747483 RepID=A0A8X6JD10_9ARAC|nr:hypothetical protein TNIN_460471 [Trichonephila inaurata madagascariensis]
MSTTSHQIGQSDKHSVLKKTRGGTETSAIGENSICSTFSCRTCAEYSVAENLLKARHSAWLKGFRFRLEETDLRLELCYSNRDVTVKNIRPAGVESKESRKKSIFNISLVKPDLFPLDIPGPFRMVVLGSVW